jgi:hypothetical protein
MWVLEGRAEALAGTFNEQGVANTLWAYATMGRSPGAGVMRVMEGRAEALAGTFNEQGVVNTLWAYATMGRSPGAGVMRMLEGGGGAGGHVQGAGSGKHAVGVCEDRVGARGGGDAGTGGRAEALEDTFKAQDVANTLWAACVFSILRAPGEGRRWINTIAQRLVSLGKSACLNTADLCQVHQVFVCCSLEPRIRTEEISDTRVLKETCREVFECTKTVPSATQQHVSETLRHMGLSVEDTEVRCPKSGYSIDIIVHDCGRRMGGERSSTVPWAVEFDGPAHFLTSRAPTGATLGPRGGERGPQK